MKGRIKIKKVGIFEEKIMWNYKRDKQLAT